MAYPASVITRTCTVGGSAAVESGTDLVLSVSIEASRGLIRDGERMPSSPEVKTSTAGGEVSFTLPVCDQSGYRDEATGAVIDISAPGSVTHTYTATITTTRGSKLVSQRVVTFPLPTGDLSPVDVDTLVEAGSVEGVLVSVPDTWGAMVAAAQAAAESAVGQIPTAVADYLTANPPSGSPDATTLAKGIVRLGGDLGGTADAPTVPGLAGKADAGHNHDDRYYTEAETDLLLAGKQAAGSYAATSHNHDAAYSPIGHNHTGTYAPALGPDDNYVTDAEKAALHTHPAVIAQGATAAAARAAIGAGTSDLAIGTTATTAKAGNYTPPAATATAQGIVELATPAEATTGADTTRAVTPQGLKAVADTKAPVTHSHTADPQPINAQTGTSYTLLAGDAGKLVTLTNAAAITLTVPGSVFVAGQRVDCIVAGAGMVTAVGSSCTVNGTPSLVSRARWSAFTVLFTSATTAIMIGDLA